MWMRLLLIAATLIALCRGKTVSSSNTAFEQNLLAAELYNAVATDHANENFVVSPAAIQISMALAFYGAKGQTATELQQGMRLGSSNAEEVSHRFGDFRRSLTRDNNIRLANNIYINENLEYKGSFRDVAQRQFDSNIDKLDFHPPYNKRTADGINREMETKTNGKIVNILKPELLNDRTEGVIVNGVTYSAPWQKAFKLDKTTKRSFRTASGQSMQVDTMWTVQNFNYAEVSSLDAKVVELPYQNPEYSMLLVLPNRKDGLRPLQQNLVGKNLIAEIERDMSSQKVEVYLPKFSVTSALSLEQPFKQLGITTMFSRNGDFGNMYRMFVSHFINSVEHKAHIEVSEAGVEQSLESGGLRSFFSRSKKFEANHPFIFAIKFRDSIIFMGHIAN